MYIKALAILKVWGMDKHKVAGTVVVETLLTAPEREVWVYMQCIGVQRGRDRFNCE